MLHGWFWSYVSWYAGSFLLQQGDRFWLYLPCHKPAPPLINDEKIKKQCRLIYGILSIIHKEKGVIYSDKKQHQEALDNYLLAHKLNPKKKFYLYLIAEQYDALNKKKEALEYYQQVFDSIDEKKGLDLLTASIRDFSESRIDRLKEELFMEKWFVFTSY